MTISYKLLSEKINLLVNEIRVSLDEFEEENGYFEDRDPNVVQEHYRKTLTAVRNILISIQDLL